MPFFLEKGCKLFFTLLRARVETKISVGLIFAHEIRVVRHLYPFSLASREVNRADWVFSRISL